MKPVILVSVLLLFVATASFLVGWNIKSAMLTDKENHLFQQELVLQKSACVRQTVGQDYVPQLFPLENISTQTP